MVHLVRLAITAFAIWLAAQWVNGIDIKVPEDAETIQKIAVVVGIAIVFTIVNALVKPIVQLLSLPLVILTLGLFLLVINALMLLLTASITDAIGRDYGLDVDGFWTAVWGAIIIALVNWVLGVLVPDEDRRSR
ncbi:phage holin family protein [Antrihabitans sp. YC2-6]|jgi:putative membrane protein|uniref:phage holin family protein n=1 Tax=Antrihabitans sp. YC2-6 TaxID=2799498 RepID=UPI0018F33089|nr:phage holin family protein [Antrihabitans sp. YC2-6]MBJ8347908.1 phage holin family protein [Antrihabitans sp. YC2-6]